MRSERFRKYVLELSLLSEELPTNEEHFLRFYDPEREHNPFWEQVHAFCSEVDLAQSEAGRKSDRLDTLVSALRGGMSLEKIERRVADVVRERVQRVAVIGGILSFSISVWQEQVWREQEKSPLRITIGLKNREAHGHLRYSMALTRLGNRDDLPEGGFWGTIARYSGYNLIANCYRGIRYELARRKAMRDVVLTTSPRELEADVVNWLGRHVESLGNFSGDSKGPAAPPINLKDLNGGEIKVAFLYDENGLKVKVYSISPGSINDPINPAYFLPFDDHAYSPPQRRAIDLAHEVLNQDWKETLRSLLLGRFHEALIRARPGFFDQAQPPSPKTDRVCKWYAIRNMYGTGSLCEAVKTCEQYRQFFNCHLSRLKQVARMVDKICLLAKSHNLPVCVAEPLPNNNHVVEFSGIVPIHLLDAFKGDRTVAVPLSLPTLNGQMICLTGKHGGGKTTALISVLAALYMAQSVLLAFGDHFRFNPKRVLASLLIERGKGSTVELILKKLKEILLAARRVSPNEMVAVIDELGSATQEVAGDKLGRRVIATLGGRGVSIIFATQIQDLAHFAKSRLNAHACAIDRDHRVMPDTISDGGLDELCDGLGVSRLLEAAPSN